MTHSTSELVRIAALFDELSRISVGMAMLDSGGRISSMVISPPALGEGEVPPVGTPGLSPAVLNTSDLLYPPQMIEGIKQQLNARRAAINQELATLGVTEAR